MSTESLIPVIYALEAGLHAAGIGFSTRRVNGTAIAHNDPLELAEGAK
jgi:hypothetical protein